MKILIVEDDPIVAESLHHLLASYAYAVDIASDAEVGLELVEIYDYDLLVLDVILPGMDGLSLCQQLRDQHQHMPILLLTGQGGESHQQAAALNAGADDYVVKPFDAEELMARLQALLRRHGGNPQPILTWGRLAVAPSSRRVTYGDQLLSLTPKEYGMLELLLHNPQTVFSARAMLDHVWESTESPGEEVVRYHIKELRRKLSDASAPKDLIETLHRVGYRLNPMYSSWVATQAEQHSCSPQVAELTATNEQLRTALEELRLENEALRQHNAELQASCEAFNDVKQQIAERTAERGQVEQELHQQTVLQKQVELNRQALSDALTHAIEGISRLDGQGRYQFVNDAYARMVGYAPSELEGMDWRPTVHPDDVAKVEAAFQTMVQEGKVECEVRGMRKNGSVFYKQVVLVADCDDQRQVTGHYCFIKDISDRKQAEARLRQQVRQEYLLTDIAQDIRRSLKLDHVLTRTVHRVREWLDTDRVIIFRFRPDWQGDVITESVGEGWPSILSTTIADPCFAQHYIEPYRHGHVSTLTNIDDANLNPCYAQLLKPFQVKANLAVPILQGEALWGLLIAHQCSAPRQWQSSEIALLRRLATQVGIAIQQSELYEQTQRDLLSREHMQAMLAEQATLLDIASDAIFVRDLDHHILYWNQGAERLYGWSAAEAVGQQVDALLLHDPERRAKVTQILLTRGEWSGELQSQTKTGQTVTVAARHTLVRDEAGQPKSILSVITDITEKKQLEAQFYQAQRLESLGQLASGIAHDLNNVFSPIMSLAQLLTMTQPDLTSQGKEQLQLIEKSARRGANLVKQVLAITRGSSGERTVVNLVEVLEEVVTMAQQSLPKAIEIHPQFLDPNLADPPLGTVFANPTQLHQVFMNLCINARDAMPEGGELTISAQNTYVNQATAKKHLHANVGPYVVITVADTGVGMEPEVRDRIFDPFFTTKESGKGTGLGLSTVFSIVKNTGGFLQVVSRVGRGTAMKVFLPAVTDPPEEDCPDNETAPEDLSSQATGHGELILVIDDDETVQQTIQSLLEAHHYTAQIASDGVEALERYQRAQDRIRLVVLDINMPHMGGIELIQRLKSMNPAVHIIAISGLPANQESSLKAGANVFLSKPYSLETFIAQVENLLTD